MPLPLVTSRLLGLSLLLVAACDGGDAVTADASIDMDLGPPHPIVGRWERQPFGFGQPDQPVSVEFQHGGRYIDGPRVGTWSVENDMLTTETNASERLTEQFYLSGDNATLVTGALFPTTPTMGLVGTWTGEFTTDGIRTVTTFEFRDDFTLSWTSELFPAGTMRTSPGDWQLEGSSVLIHADLGQIVTVGVRVIPDIIIGSELLIRTQ